MSSTLEKILNKAKNEGKTLDMSTVAYTLGYAAGKKMETKMGTLIFLFRKRRRRNDANRKSRLQRGDDRSGAYTSGQDAETEE